jgi:hypothetical protein
MESMHSVFLIVASSYPGQFELSDLTDTDEKMKGVADSSILPANDPEGPTS